MSPSGRDRWQTRTAGAGREGQAGKDRRGWGRREERRGRRRVRCPPFGPKFRAVKWGTIKKN
jgi:hypothetical protein